jgi:hypothetical protein
MALYEEEMFDEMAFDEAEGAAESFEEGFDEFDEFEEGDEMDAGDAFDEFDEGESMEAGDEFDEGEGFDEFDEFEEGDEGEDDAFEAAMSFALAAEDTDEFFRRIGGFLRRAARGVGQVARRAAPVIGQVARAAAPILRSIPLPQAQAAGAVANLLGQLRFEGASEEEALEAMAEMAARNPRLLPVVGGLAARTLVRRAGATLTPQARQRVVRQMTQAARVLTTGPAGPRGVTALPRIVRSVQRTAAARRTRPQVRPQVALNTARRVAANPRMTRRLARPLPRGQQLARRAAAALPPAQRRRIMPGGMGGGIGAGVVGPAVGAAIGGIVRRPGWGGGAGRSITIRGPVRIIVRPN